MKILFLSHFYPPEIGGAAARIHGLARWMASFGHQVTVITGLPNYPTGVVPPSYRGATLFTERQDGVKLVRTWVYASAHTSTKRRLANYFSYVFSSLLATVRARVEYEIVVASSPPLFIGISGWALSRLGGVPLVFDVPDIWPELAVEAGRFSPDAAIVRWGERLERFVYRASQSITVVTEAKRRKLLGRDIPDARIRVVPNGIDMDDIDQSLAAENTIRQDLGLADRFVVIYAGLIGFFQGVGQIIEAAKIVAAETDIHFLIVGEGIERIQVMDKARKLGLENTTFLPSQPRDLIPRFISAADLVVVPLIKNSLADAVPSKLLEAWACRRPVVLAAAGDAERTLEAAEGGIAVPAENPHRLAEAVLELRANPSLREAYGRNGYRYVVANFNRPELARRLEAVLEESVQNHG